MEHSENGRAGRHRRPAALSRLSDLFTGRSPKGGNAVLTIDPKVQETAYKAMASRRLGRWPEPEDRRDPGHGEHTVLRSQPALLARLGHVQKNYKKLLKDPGDPMLDRAISQTYPPGSVFKTVVSAAALKNGTKADRPDPGAGRVPAAAIPATYCTTSTARLRRRQTDTFTHALTISATPAFAELGVEPRRARRSRTSAEFGITGKGFKMPLNRGRQRHRRHAGRAKTASPSIGQQDVRSPAQGAMIAAGDRQRRHADAAVPGQQIQANDFSVVDSTSPRR